MHILPKFKDDTDEDFSKAMLGNHDSKDFPNLYKLVKISQVIPMVSVSIVRGHSDEK